MWLEFCTCGYRGFYWHKHRETSLRWGHRPDDHIFLGAILCLTD
jgi:hypothetical protein